MFIGPLILVHMSLDCELSTLQVVDIDGHRGGYDSAEVQ